MRKGRLWLPFFLSINRRKKHITLITNTFATNLTHHMNKLLTLLPALALLQAETASAAPRHFQTKHSAASHKRTIAEEYQFGKSAWRQNSGINANKTTATERLTIMSYYDFTQPSNQLTDSFKITYSNGRGSKFNFVDMTYGTDELDAGNDYGYFDYDKAYDQLSGGAEVASRTYNSNNKVVEQEYADGYKMTFSYNSSNQLVQTASFEYDNATSSWENDQLHFYKYNAAGQRIEDSVESWNEADKAWEFDSKNVNTYDGSGRLIKITGSELFMGSMQTSVEHSYTYTGALTLPSTYVFRYFNSNSMSLENLWKDVTGYTGTMKATSDSYVWDNSTSTWELNSEERRHLNGANLPDSISYTYYNNGSVDKKYYSLFTYNSNNNPVFQLDMTYTQSTPEYVFHYEYGPVEAAAVAQLKFQSLEFYPNPVSDKIQLKGLNQGKYLIYNTAGQLVQSGSVQNGNVSVETLVPGTYMLSVQTAGQTHQARFVRL